MAKKKVPLTKEQAKIDKAKADLSKSAKLALSETIEKIRQNALSHHGYSTVMAAQFAVELLEAELADAENVLGIEQDAEEQEAGEEEE